MLSGQTTNALTVDMLLESVNPLLDLNDHTLLLLLSQLDRLFLKLCSEKRNKLVAAGVEKKSKLIGLWDAVTSRNTSLKLSDVLDLEFLESIKDFKNPVISRVVVSCFENYKSLPLRLNYPLLSEIHKQAKVWEDVHLKKNGLLGFFIKLLNLLNNLDDVSQYGMVADEFLMTLCCLKIICDLKDEKYFESFRNGWITVNTKELMQGKQLENEALAAKLKEGISLAYLTKSSDAMDMMTNLFSVDGELNIVLNVAYFNQVVAYVQNRVSFEHMEKKHKATTCSRYQLTMFDSAIKKLRGMEMLDEEGEKKVRDKYYVSSWM